MRISDWSSDVCSSDLCAATPPLLRRALLPRLLLGGEALAVHLDEVDRADHQRREAAVACHLGYDGPGEGEQEARHLDQDQRLDMLLLDLAELDDAGVIELGDEEGVEIGRAHV